MPFPIRLFGSKKTADTLDYKSTSSTINNVEVKVKQGDITKEKVSNENRSDELLIRYCLYF